MAVTRPGLTDREILGWIRSRWVVAIAGIAAVATTGAFQYAFSAFAPLLQQHYKWSPVDTGLLFTLYIVLQSFAAIPGGFLVDRFGGRAVTIISAVLCFLGYLALALGPNYWLVAALWIIGAFGAGVIYIAAVTLANKWFPDRRGLVVGLTVAMYPWSGIPFAAMFLGIPKNAPFSTFFSAVLFTAIFALVVGIIMGIFMKAPPKGWLPPGWVPRKAVKRPSEHQYTFREAISTWQFWALQVSYLLIASAYLSGVSQMVSYARSFGFTEIVVLFSATLLAFMSGLSRIVLGWISDYFGRENTMILAFFLTGVLIFVTIYAGQTANIALFLLAVAIANFLAGAEFVLFPSIVAQYYGEVAAGANYGILRALGKGSGGIYGGALTALLIQAGGYPFAFTISGVLAVLSSLVVILVKLRPPIWRPKEVPATVKPTGTDPAGQGSSVQSTK